MEPKENEFHFSFFKPTTESARHNRNMVVQFVLIWAVAIFGFQILLKVVEKPTPEPAYLVYQSVWPAIEAGTPGTDALKSVSQSALNVLGKVAITPSSRAALDNLISWAAYNIADSLQKGELIEKISVFEAVAATTEDITADDYVAAKNDLIPLLQNIFGLSPNDVRAKIAAVEVKSTMVETFSDENREAVGKAMDFYLIHNRSFLTDGKFLGFPFHYFYTAVLLLILFVGLCWLYCLRTDMFNKRYEIED